jgi:hypothetical protein
MDRIASVAFSADGHTLATGSFDKGVRHYRITGQGKTLKLLLQWQSINILSSTSANIEGCHLSNNNKRLLEQRGAKGKALISTSNNVYSMYGKSQNADSKALTDRKGKSHIEETASDTTSRYCLQ